MILAITIAANAHEYSSTCNENDAKAPCKCQMILTNMLVHKEGRLIDVEFTESVCNPKINYQRSVEGKIPSGFQCVQIKSHKTLYRDAEEQPIEIPISYRAGCELRCTTKKCLQHLYSLFICVSIA